MKPVHSICEKCLYAKVDFTGDLIVEYTCMITDTVASSFDMNTGEWLDVSCACLHFSDEDEYACPIPF